MKQAHDHNGVDNDVIKYAKNVHSESLCMFKYTPLYGISFFFKSASNIF